ncbi:MAG: DUF3300 domain-containing protein [Candidatus Omnitrophica bacterium]|nr:DUF3300 domain-containing protein [Candidatus Omnitrophota bacterium]
MLHLPTKVIVALTATLVLATPVLAQDLQPFEYAQAPSYAQSPAANPYTPLTPAELDELVAPIALYPDPLIGILLPASTFPLQVVQASRYLHANQGVVDPPQGSSWDSSVIALLRYPDVLFMMDEQIEWTGRLGDAMYYQEDDVMAAVQRVRAKAQSKGILESNDKQEIVQNNGYIRIEPAQPEVVYVPVYDPQVIFVETAPVYPVITYGIGYSYGPWLPYVCDWSLGGFFFTNFYFGGHWHTHHGGHHSFWRPRHHPRHHHGDRDDWEGDGDGHRGDGGGHRGDGGGPRDIQDVKVPRSNDGRQGGKVPVEDVASRKVPRTDPSGYPLDKPSDFRASGKTPRKLNWESVSEGKTPSRVGYDRGVQYDRKPNRTTIKIPNQSGYSGRMYKVPDVSSRSYAPKTPQSYKAPSYSVPSPSFKVPSNSYKAPVNRSYKTPSVRSYNPPSSSYKMPSAPSMKVPSSRGFSGGGHSGGKGFGGGGGKVPKGGK